MENPDGQSDEDDGNELKRALNRRRKVVERQGSNFVKEKAIDPTNKADVTCHEVHHTQFTPRGKAAERVSEYIDNRVYVSEDEEEELSAAKSGTAGAAPQQVSAQEAPSAKPAARSRLAQFSGNSGNSGNSAGNPAAAAATPVNSAPAFAEAIKLESERLDSKTNAVPPVVPRLELGSSKATPDVEASAATTSPAASATAVTEVEKKSRAEIAKSQLLLPKALDGKVPPLGDLPTSPADASAASGARAQAAASEAVFRAQMAETIAAETAAPKPVAARVLGGGIAGASASTAFAPASSPARVVHTAALLPQQQQPASPVGSAGSVPAAAPLIVGQPVSPAGSASSVSAAAPVAARVLAPGTNGYSSLPASSGCCSASAVKSAAPTPVRISAADAPAPTPAVPPPAAIIRGPPSDLDATLPFMPSMSTQPSGSQSSVQRMASAPRGPPGDLDATLPFMPSMSTQPGVQSGRPSMLGVQRMVSAPVQSMQTQNGDQRIWRAIVDGDLQTLEGLAHRGAVVSGRMLDHNGHSILWNAVAFQQPHVALWLIRRFPPEVGAASGVDLGEVHARRGDSLLHLCMYFTDFSAHVAELFRSVFTSGSSSSSQAPRSLENKNGQTFLSIAAARLNFWVIGFVLSKAPDCASLFLKKDAKGGSPLSILRQRVRESSGAPVVAKASELPLESKMPQWCALPMPGRVVEDAAEPSFSDLVLEVEDPGAAGGLVRVAAHRVVLGACSSVFDAKIRNSAASGVLRVDPVCCRSGEVLQAMLYFCYRGEVSLSFGEDGFLLWQLLCLSVQYGLPRALTVHARTALVASLGEVRHAPLLLPLLQAKEKVGLTDEEACFAAFALLGSPQTALQGIQAEEARAQALSNAIKLVEQHALSQNAATVKAAAPQGGMAPPPTPALGTRDV